MKTKSLKVIHMDRPSLRIEEVETEVGIECEDLSWFSH